MTDSVANAAANKKVRRFVTLDALRGVGAATVMAGHAGPLLGGYSPPFFYLAVDMFFVLSGFVIACAYDEKMAGGMLPLEFLRARVRRLYPIYFVGLLAGLVSVLFNNPHGLSLAQAVVTFVCGLFALPSPPMGPFRALFPLNGPFWSLFLEFWIANVSFAFLWHSLRGKVLWAFIVFWAAVLLVGVLRAKSLDLGWNWHNAPGGLARVCFSFYVGVFLARLHAKRPPKLKVPSLMCLLAFCAVMVLPVGEVWTPIVGLFVIFVVFPALIYWGAEAIEGHPAVGRAFGDASYALYAIHRPLIYVLAWLLTLKPFVFLQKQHALLTQAGTMIFIGLLAWGINGLFSRAKARTVLSSGAPTKVGVP
jgi:peptidoglycan/LPS O-acetylase OafA/YrhL